MIQKPIDRIAEEDLRALVDNGVPERKMLQYKRCLPGDSAKQKAEFLADVSSFANAGGGDIVYGIEAQAGVPKALVGLDLADVDAAVLRLENMVRDGTRPRIPGIHTRGIPLRNSRVAIVLKVPNSWVSPHRVMPNDRFYSRSSNGKYPLDVDELRLAFTATEALADRIRDFRADRIAKILADETPVLLHANAKLVLHLIPLGALGTAQHVDVGMVMSGNDMRPVRCDGWTPRYNLDGVVSYSGGSGDRRGAYTQLYRTGIIEAVEATLLRPQDGNKYIPHVACEKELITSLSEYLAVLRALGVEPPTLLFLNLLEVKGYSMPTKDRFVMDSYPIERDHLLLPERLIEDYAEPPEHILKPLFDAIWNACGFRGSP